MALKIFNFIQFHNPYVYDTDPSVIKTRPYYRQFSFLKISSFILIFLASIIRTPLQSVHLALSLCYKEV